MLFACGSSPTFGFELEEKRALKGLGHTVDVPECRGVDRAMGSSRGGFYCSSPVLTQSAQPQCLQKHSAKVMPGWEERRNTTRHKSGCYRKPLMFPTPLATESM